MVCHTRRSAPDVWQREERRAGSCASACARARELLRSQLRARPRLVCASAHACVSLSHTRIRLSSTASADFWLSVLSVLLVGRHRGRDQAVPPGHGPLPPLRGPQAPHHLL
eukprot:3088263-Rhodomonas_salina.1